MQSTALTTFSRGFKPETGSGQRWTLSPTYSGSQGRCSLGQPWDLWLSHWLPSEGLHVAMHTLSPDLTVTLGDENTGALILCHATRWRGTKRYRVCSQTSQEVLEVGLVNPGLVLSCPSPGES